MSTNRTREQVGKWNAFFDGLRCFFFPPRPDFSDLDYDKKPMFSHCPQKQVGRGYAFWGKLRRLLFPLASDFAEERDFSYDKKAIERKIVARFSRSNVRLQQGRYITREEIDAGLRRCREYAEKYGD